MQVKPSTSQNNLSINEGKSLDLFKEPAGIVWSTLVSLSLNQPLHSLQLYSNLSLLLTLLDFLLEFNFHSCIGFQNLLLFLRALLIKLQNELSVIVPLFLGLTITFFILTILAFLTLGILFKYLFLPKINLCNPFLLCQICIKYIIKYQCLASSNIIAI